MLSFLFHEGERVNHKKKEKKAKQDFSVSFHYKKLYRIYHEPKKRRKNKKIYLNYRTLFVFVSYSVKKVSIAMKNDDVYMLP